MILGEFQAVRDNATLNARPMQSIPFPQIRRDDFCQPHLRALALCQVVTTGCPADRRSEYFVHTKQQTCNTVLPETSKGGFSKGFFGFRGNSENLYQANRGILIKI